jgi:hypothetical protein
VDYFCNFDFNSKFGFKTLERHSFENEKEWWRSATFHHI